MALAAALDSCECEIYTDVDGVYTTDPNLCSTARKLDRVTYEEMLEMASMGAKVLQIRSVEFAKKYNVPVHVRSTFSDDPGTLVAQEDAMMEIVARIGGTGVEHDPYVAKVSVIGVGMRNHTGVATKAFAALQQENINIQMISTSEIKISCLIDEKYTELAVRTLHDAFELHKPDHA